MNCKSPEKRKVVSVVGHAFYALFQQHLDEEQHQ